MSTTWIRFNNAIKAQGLDRKTFLPYRSRFQPYCAWYALTWATIILILSGYTLFYVRVCACLLVVLEVLACRESGLPGSGATGGASCRTKRLTSPSALFP